MSTTTVGGWKNDHAGLGSLSAALVNSIVDALEYTRFGFLSKDAAGSGTTTLDTTTEAPYSVIEFTGVLTGARTFNLPANAGQKWAIQNATTGSYSLTVSTSGGTGVTITQGYGALVYCDGTNIERLGVDTTNAGAVALDAILGNDATLTITGKAGSAGAGGAVTVTAGAGDSGAGGAASLTAGAGNGANSGGAASVAGGASGAGATGTGGAASVTGGAAASTNGTGGAASLVGGTGSGTNAGGAAIATGGVGGATGAGGAVTFTGGAGGATSGAGGAATLRGGAGSAGNSAGGASSLIGGAGQGSAAGGATAVTGGAGGATGAGGAVTVTGGAGGATSGAAGGVTLAGGTPTDGNGGAVAITASAGVGTNRNGGDVTLTPGAPTGSGTRGRISMAGPVSSPVTTAQDLATGNTITLPTSGRNKRVTASGGAATGVILTAGRFDGEEIVLLNADASNSVTFAAAGTSNVADGASSVIAALTAMKLVWDNTSSRWFRVA